MTDEGKKTCPLCMEEMDLTDQQLKPCLCGYEICVWCWHHIMEIAEKNDTQGRCPACRASYDKERIIRTTISRERLAELNSEKKQKLQKAKSNASEVRKHLSSFRVIRRNLVYIAGLPVKLADKETLQKKEFLGQYGKVLKVVMTRASPTNQHFFSNNSCSVYVTFSKDEEAIRCIQVVNGFILDGRPLKACFGTTKYCNAWLKNMPCGNPDCMYLHDAGKQEDICSRDEVASACTSKVQQTFGVASTDFQRRSGSFFPPPIDDICSKSNTTMSKPLVKPVVSSPVAHEKSFLQNDDSEKCGFLPAASSWGLRMSSGRSSSTSVASIQGPFDKKPCTLSCFSTSVEAQLPMQAHETFQSNKQNVTSRNQAPLSDCVLANISSFKPCDRKNHSSHSTALHVKASLGTDALVKYTVNESSSFPIYDDMFRGSIQMPYSLDANGFCLPSSTSLLSDATSHLTVDEATQPSPLILHSSSNGTHTDSGCLDISSSYFFSAQHPATPSLMDNHRLTSSLNLHSLTNCTDADFRCQDISWSNSLSVQHLVTTKDNHITRLGALTPGPKPSVTASQSLTLTYEQDALLGMSILSGNPYAKSSSLLSNHEIHGDDSTFYSGGLIMGNKVGEFPLKSTVNFPISPKGEREKLSGASSAYNGDEFKFCQLDYGCQIPTLLEDWSWNSGACDKASNDSREDNIISDILSLDLGLEHPFTSPHGLAKLLLGDSSKKKGCSRIFSSGKSCHGNGSRFSFTRIDDSSKASEEAHYLGINDSGQKDNSEQVDIVDNDTICLSKSVNGLIYKSKDSELFNAHPYLFPNEVSNKSEDQRNLHQSALHQLQMPEVLSLPRIPGRNSALPTPPGFYPRHAADKDPFPMLSSSASSVHYQFFGNSPQTDPAIVNREKLPMSMTNLISPNYSSNIISPEINQRRQF